MLNRIHIWGTLYMRQRPCLINTLACLCFLWFKFLMLYISQCPCGFMLYISHIEHLIHTLMSLCLFTPLFLCFVHYNNYFGHGIHTPMSLCLFTPLFLYFVHYNNYFGHGIHTPVSLWWPLVRASSAVLTDLADLPESSVLYWGRSH